MVATAALASGAAQAVAQAPTSRPAAPAATPPATASAVGSLDVDGDGQLERISASGPTLTISSSAAIGAGATRGRVSVVRLPGAPRLPTLTAAALGGERLIALEVQVGRGLELWVGRATASGFAELARLPLGPQGGDGEYGAGAELTARGLVRWQTRPELVRCDGAAPRLFAERWDPASRRWGAAEASEVPASGEGAAVVAVAPAAAAPSATSPAPAVRVSDVFRARTATSQRGAVRADELAIPSELDDGDVETAWRLGGGHQGEPRGEGRSEGRGEVLGYRARLAAAVARRLRVVPGDASSAAALRAAARPARLWLVGKRQRFSVALPDPVATGAALGTAYLVTLPQPIEGCLSVVIDSVYPGASGAARPLAISELSVETDLEEQSGGTAALATAVARGGDEGPRAAAILARRGAAATAALLAELAQTRDVARKRRLARALAQLSEPEIGPALVAALRDGWIDEPDLAEALEALARIGAHEGLAEIATSSQAAPAARVAAATKLALAASPRQLALAGSGSREVRKAMIFGLEHLPTAELLAAAERADSAAAAGDLWRAAVRAAVRGSAAQRRALAAALVPQLASAADYERRYRLATGLVELAAHDGDAAAVALVLAQLAPVAPVAAAAASPSAAPAASAAPVVPAAAERAALRQAVAALLARLARPELTAAVDQLARDPDAGVRLAVLRATTATATATAALDAPLAAALAADRWPELRRAAAAALAQRCQRPEPAAALIRSVDSDADVDVRQDALVALVTCRAAGIGERLVRTWESGKLPLPLRSRALTLAVMLGEPRLAEPMIRALSRWRSEAFSDESALRLAVLAAASLGRLGGSQGSPGGAQGSQQGNQQIAAALLSTLEDSAYPELVAAAATGLGALGPACPAAARAKLQPLTRSDERSISLAARRALGRCGAAPAVRSPDAPDAP